MRHGWLLYYLWILVIALPAAAAVNSPGTLYVGLKRFANAQKLIISANSTFHIIDPQAKKILLECEAGQVWALTSINGKVHAVNGDNSLDCESIEIFSPDENIVQIGAFSEKLSRFHGRLLIKIVNGKLFAINDVGLESYLMGVVPSEMPSKWKVEALKAQAVAARSYTVRGQHRHEADGYDLCDGVHCQCYLGMSAERESTNEAVRLTEGIVLTSDSQIADCVYHAACGGATAASTETGFGSAQPYLIGTSDLNGDNPYCAKCPRYTWTINLTKDNIKTLLKSVKKDVGEVISLKIIAAGSSYRVQKVEIEGMSGKATVNGVSFRNCFGWDKFQSTRFTIEKNESGWLINGTGYGHGVGLCQWGANGRAEAGQTFRQILEAYYPTTKLETLVSSDITELASRGKPRTSIPPKKRALRK
ncbi:MAG: SpoIID/LytB domain-containing protein [bacterium]